MKEPLYFHIQPKTEQATVMFKDGSKQIVNISETFAPHTFCVKATPVGMLIGYAVTHKNDQFRKTIGRNLAKVRMEAAANALSKPNCIKEFDKDTRIHDSVTRSIMAVAKRAAEVLKIRDTEFPCITRVDINGKKGFARFTVTK